MLLMIMTLRQEKTVYLDVTIMNSFTNTESPGSPQIKLALHVDVRYVTLPKLYFITACYHNEQFYKHGESWQPSDHTCFTCRCQVCGRFLYYISQQFIMNSFTNMESPGSPQIKLALHVDVRYVTLPKLYFITACYHNEQFYKHGESWQPSDHTCFTCRCQVCGRFLYYISQQFIMNSFTNMESPGSPQIKLALHVDVRYVTLTKLYFITACYHNEQFYKHGESWQPSDHTCFTCRCQVCGRFLYYISQQFIMNSFTNMESPGSPQIKLALHVDVRYVDPF